MTTKILEGSKAYITINGVKLHPVDPADWKHEYAPPFAEAAASGITSDTMQVQFETEASLNKVFGGRE